MYQLLSGETARKPFDEEAVVRPVTQAGDNIETGGVSVEMLLGATRLDEITKGVRASRGKVKDGAEARFRGQEEWRNRHSNEEITGKLKRGHFW